jgi:hypothetical protein
MRRGRVTANAMTSAMSSAVIILSLRGEGGEQHDPGVVDQDVGSAELGLDPVSRRDQGIPVGDVGLDGDRAVTELADQGLDAVRTPGQQGQAEAVGGERAGGRFADTR